MNEEIFFYSSQGERQNSLWPNDVKEMKTGLLGLVCRVCVCVCLSTINRITV